MVELRNVVWYNVAILLTWHLGALYGLHLGVTEGSAKSWAAFVALWFFSGLGITAGAHRLWSHRAYKASLPVRVFLMLGNSCAFQGSIFEWSRDHRVHHKASDTDGDPYNAERGFFFSHVGWVMLKKHPKVKEVGAALDFSDLMADPVVAWQRKWYLSSVLAFCYVLPTLLGLYLTGSAMFGFMFLGIFRHVYVLNVTWLVNSAAHMWGMQPYNDKPPRENLWVTILTHGEGFHNFHHAYPHDYAAGEWGLDSGAWNPTKLFIDMCAALGHVHSRKRVNFVTKKAEKDSKDKPTSAMGKLWRRVCFGSEETFMS